MTDQEKAERIVAQMMETDAFSQWLGVEVVSVGPGRAVLRMTVRPEMVNGFGVAHGGVTYAFADSALAFASNTRGQIAVALDNNMHYPAAVHVGDVLTATAVEAAAANRVATYHVTLTREDGTPVGIFRGTVYRTKKLHLSSE